MDANAIENVDLIKVS